MKKSYRPGVYSRYDIISRPHSRQDCYAFYCGAAVLQQGKHLPAGGVVQLSSLGQVREYFSEQGAGKDFCEVCRVLLEGGAAGVYAVPITIDGRKPTTEEYTDAIGRLCEIKRSGVMMCGSCEEEVLQLLCRKVQEASEQQRERIGVGAILPEKALAAAKQMNSERMVLCAQSVKDSRLAAAAAIAAMLATAEPDESFCGAELGLETVDSLSEEQVEQFLGGGVTALEENAGRVECIRCVTTRTMTAGEADRTFASVNTVLMIDDIIRSVRERLEGMLRGTGRRLGPDSISSQVAVVLDEKKQQGVLVDFEPPVVYPEESDPTVCVVELEFHLAAVLSQIYLTAHITV